jgi:hydrogenase large subunit
VDAKATKFDLPGGVIMNGNLSSVRPIQDWHDQPIRAAVAEDVTHAWYQGEGLQQPRKGKTDPNWTQFPNRANSARALAPQC